MNAQMVAARFGCTVEQARRQYRRNADQLWEMRDRALETGKKVNGYTADQLRDMAVRMENACES